MGYAAPAAGILCNELLHPSFTGSHHPRSPKITRSAIIQQLSLLVSFLGWTRPDAPNADLCTSCRTITQRVLDYTLNAGSSPPRPQEAAQYQSLEDILGHVPDAENIFSFDLLDTYDWLRPDVLTTGVVSL